MISTISNYFNNKPVSATIIIFYTLYTLYTMIINRIAILLVLGLVDIITVGSSAKSFPELYFPHKKGTYSNF